MRYVVFDFSMLVIAFRDIYPLHVYLKDRMKSVQKCGVFVFSN